MSFVTMCHNVQRSLINGCIIWFLQTKKNIKRAEYNEKEWYLVY